MIALLEQHAATLGTLSEAAEAGIAAAIDAGVPAIFLSEERYSQALRRAGREWLSHFTNQLRSGELQWPRPPATKDKRK